MNSLFIGGNIIKRAFRNRREIIVLLILPIAAVCIMTFLTGSQAVQSVNAGLVNLDSGGYGQKLADYITGIENIAAVSLDENEYKDAVNYGRTNLAIVIPEDFTADIEGVRKTSIGFLSSGTNEAYEKLKQDIDRYVSGLYIVDSSASDISKRTGEDKSRVLDTIFKNAAGGNLTTELTLAGNAADEQNKARLIQSIGFAIMFIMVFVFITIGTIIEDRKRLTLARISTFKVNEWEIVTGNLLGSLALGMIQLVPVIAVLSLIYNLQSPEEICGMFIIMLCFLVSAIGLGIGISGVIKNNLNPILLTAIVIFPTSLLGGCLIPDSMLPGFIAKLGYAVPQKWVMTAIQKLMTGSGLQGILPDLGIILLFGLVLSTFGVKTLKPLNE